LCARRRDECLENGAQVGLVLEQHDGSDLAIPRALVIDQRVPADLTEPRVERGLTAIAVEALDRLAERQLHDITGGFLVAVEAGEGKAIQSRKKLSKKWNAARRRAGSCRRGTIQMPRHSLAQPSPSMD
jgi:hypothetical protein